VTAGASGRRRRAPNAVGTVLLIALALGAVGCGGQEWFSSAAARTDRNAARSSGGNNQTSDIGNAINGNCATTFDYRVIRVRVEVTPESNTPVTVDFDNVPGESPRTLDPGRSHTWVLDKGVGHCRFAGPGGTIHLNPGTVSVQTKEGYTPYFGTTDIDGNVDGQSFSVDPGDSEVVSPWVEVSRSDDPGARTAEITLTVTNSRLPDGFSGGIR